MNFNCGLAKTSQPYIKVLYKPGALKSFILFPFGVLITFELINSQNFLTNINDHNAIAY